MEGCDKCIVRDATVISLQDTLLWNGRIYADNVLIEGNVDFVWGDGAAYFVELRDPDDRPLGLDRAGAQSGRPATATSSSTASSPPTPASPAACWRASTSAPIPPATSPTSIAR